MNNSSYPAPRLTRRITKLKAAHSQLCTAIQLFFEERDPVSIHTLTAAALDVLRDIGKNRGQASLLKDYPFIRQDKRKEFNKAMNRYQNFFKHADLDPDDVLEDFNPEVTEFLLLDAVELFSRLGGKLKRELGVYHVFFQVKYPQFLASPDNAHLISGLPDKDNKTAWLELLRNLH